MRNTGRILVSSMLVGAIFLVTLLCVTPVDASPFTTVTISLQADPPTVDVSPGSSGVVTVYGLVTCVKYGPDTVKVFLQAQSDFGSANVVPANFVFSGSSGSEQNESFSVTTKVPQGFSSKATPQISVGGYYDQGGLRTSIAPVSQLIIIEQYYAIEANSASGDELVGEPGEKIDLKVSVGNTGNGDDTFVIDFENRDLLNGKGFKLTSPLELTMMEDDYRTVFLEIGIPEDITGDQALHVLISSKGSESSDSPCKYRIMVNLHIVTNSTSENIIETNELMDSDYFILLIIIIVVAIPAAVAVALKMKRREVRHYYP